MLRGALGNYGSRFVTLGTWFVLTPFILRRLGPTEYGLWVLVGSVVAYGWLLNFGVGRTITRFVARYVALGRIQETQELIATAFWLYCLLGLVAALVAAALAPIFPNIFQVPASSRSLASSLVLVMGVQVGLSLPCVTATAVLQGLHRYDLTAAIEAVGTLAYAGLIVSILTLGGGLIAMVLANLPVVLGTQLVSAYLVRRVDARLIPSLSWRKPHPEHVRRILSFSWALFVMEISDSLQRKTDEVVIGLVLPIGAITPYSLARRMADLARNLVAQFQVVLLPLVSKLDAEDDRARLRFVYLTATRLSLLVFVPVGGSIAMLAGWVLTVWVGPAYADAENEQLVGILALAGLCWVIQGPTAQVFQGMARHRAPAVVSAITGLANLVLSIALVQPFGLTGVALGTLLPALAELVVFRLPYTMRLVRVGPVETFASGWLPALLPLAPMTLVIVLARQNLGPPALGVVLLVALIALVTYFATYALVGAWTPELRLARRFVADQLQARAAR